MYMATVILAVLLGAGFGLLGIAKLADAKPMAQARQHLGIPSALFRAIGAFEVFGGVGLLLGLHPDLVAIGVFAAVGLIAMTIGAGFYHQRAGDSMTDWIPAVLVGSLASYYIILRIASI